MGKGAAAAAQGVVPGRPWLAQRCGVGEGAAVDVAIAEAGRAVGQRGGCGDRGTGRSGTAGRRRPRAEAPRDGKAIAAITARVRIGSLYLHPFGPCPKCKGTGHIKRGNRGRVKVCPRCKGQRRIQRTGSRTIHELARKIRQGRQAAAGYQQEDGHGDTDGAHTHGSGGSGLGTAVLVLAGAALAVKLAGPIVAAAAELVWVLAIVVAVIGVAPQAARRGPRHAPASSEDDAGRFAAPPSTADRPPTHQIPA